MFGQPIEAEALLRSGLQGLSELGERGYWTSSFAAVLARALVEQGRMDEAQAWLTSSEGAGDASSVGSSVIWSRLHARLQAARGDHREAEGSARTAIANEDPYAVNGRGDAFDDLGKVLLAADRVADARQAFGEALALYREKGNVLSSSRVESRIADLSPRGLS